MFVYAAEVATTIRGAARYGIDAHIDGVRWDDIVSRVFGRIDPIALGGEDYRRSAPNIDVYHSTPGSVRRNRTGVICCAPMPAKSSPRTRW